MTLGVKLLCLFICKLYSQQIGSVYLTEKKVDDIYIMLNVFFVLFVGGL